MAAHSIIISFAWQNVRVVYFLLCTCTTYYFCSRYITYKYLYMERRRPKLEWDGNHRKKLMGNDFSLRCPVKPLIEWVRYTSIEPTCRERKRGCLRTILRFGVPFCLIVPHHTDLKCSSISHQRWWSWWKKVVVISLNFHQSAQNNFPAIEEAWLKISNQ